MKNCEYYSKCAVKGYCTCTRDGSRRKDPCHCRHYEEHISLFRRIKEWFIRNW